MWGSCAATLHLMCGSLPPHLYLYLLCAVVLSYPLCVLSSSHGTERENSGKNCLVTRHFFSQNKKLVLFNCAENWFVLLGEKFLEVSYSRYSFLKYEILRME